MNMEDEWDADFLTVQDSLDSLDESIPGDLAILQYRRWPDFENMIAHQGIRFRRADTFNRKGEKEGIVHQRIHQAFSDPEDVRMLLTLKLARFLYISCFTIQDETPALWNDFAPDSEDVCLVTTASNLRKTKPASVVMMQTEYGVDWNGPNPSDQIFQDKIEYEQICSVEGLEYENHGEFSFAVPLKYLLNRYRYQDEVRLVYCPVSITLDGYSTWTSFEADDHGDEVVFVEFPLRELLLEVRFRSDAPTGHVHRVRKLLASVNCSANVVQSALP